MKGADSLMSERPAGAPARTGERNGMFSRAIRRDVILLLGLKTAALTLLYFLFFSHKPVVDPASVQRQLTQQQER